MPTIKVEEEGGSKKKTTLRQFLVGHLTPRGRRAAHEAKVAKRYAPVPGGTMSDDESSGSSPVLKRGSVNQTEHVLSELEQSQIGFSAYN